MWLCVDRIEGDIVVLVDERDKTLSLTRGEYLTLVGVPPAESDMLSATVTHGRLVEATRDEAETAARKAAARARLERLFGKS